MKKIDGQLIKIEATLRKKVFYNFEFIGDNDSDTYGLICFTRLNNPNTLILIQMNDDELSNIDIDQGINTAKARASLETSHNDLIFPKLLGHIKKNQGTSQGFKKFLKSYTAPTSVYKNIYNENEEAVQTEPLSIDSFEAAGGTVKLLGKSSLH